jgi:hypothetical protein
MPCYKQICLLVVLGLVPSSLGWSSITNNGQVVNHRQPTLLSVASQDVRDIEKQAEEEKVPYAIARGDGSTGGGGLPMPNSNEKENGLTRPKVGAQMPEG